MPSCPITVASIDVTPTPPGPLNDDTLSIVEAAMGDAKNFAEDAEERALAAIEALSRFAVDLPGITVPTIPIPTIDLPLLDNPPDAPENLTASFPSAPEAPPDAVFNWSEAAAYTTALLTAMNARLLALVQGMSTGLTPEVEQAIWDRARARERVNAERGMEEIRAGYAARGYICPPGAMLIALQRAEEDAIDKDAELSREIMAKQADLEQANFQFSVTQSINLEGHLMDLFTATQNRALEAAKSIVTIPLEIFKAKVEAYRAGVQAEAERLDALVKVFTGQVSAYGEIERAKIGITTAQAEVIKAEAQAYAEQARLSIEAQDANLRALQTAHETVQTSLRAAGQIAGQLAAAALAARNVHASIQSSSGTSSTSSVQRSAAYHVQTSTSSSCQDVYNHKGS